MEYKPIQTNQMSATEKIRNMVWEGVNATLFRITPPFGYIQKASCTNA